METKFGKWIRCVTLICFLICCGSFKTAAFRCFSCRGLKECAKVNIPKNGSVQGDSSYIKECTTTKSHHHGSERCHARRTAEGFDWRGCTPVDQIESWDPSEVKPDCPLLKKITTSDVDVYLNVQDTCYCYTDLCNGDPSGCCASKTEYSHDYLYP